MLIWKNSQTRSRFKIGILNYDEKYTFKYVNPELDDALDSGFEFFLVLKMLIGFMKVKNYLRILRHVYLILQEQIIY